RVLPRPARASPPLRSYDLELVDHGVDGVLELQDLALHVHGDLLGEIARRHRLRHVGDVAHLAGEVARHEVHAIRQILPRATHTLDLGLPTQLALRAHLAPPPPPPPSPLCSRAARPFC